MIAQRKNTGFSMIEVLITIVILMIGLLGLAGLQTKALTAQMESYQRSQALILLKDMASRIEANRNVASCYAVSNAPSSTSLGTGTAPSSITTAIPCTGYATVRAQDASSRTTSYCTTTGSCVNTCIMLPSGAPATCPTDATSLATANALATTRAVQGAPIALSDLQAWHKALLGEAELQGASNVSCTNCVGAMIGARGCITQTVAPATGAPAQYLVAVAWQGLNNTAAPAITCGSGQYGNEALRRVVAIPVNVADLN